jgi:hypothetical protein
LILTIEGWAPDKKSKWHQKKDNCSVGRTRKLHPNNGLYSWFVFNCHQNHELMAERSKIKKMEIIHAELPSKNPTMRNIKVDRNQSGTVICSISTHPYDYES